jgi:hypothetical protein
MREPAKGERKALSEKANFRLKVFDWYRNEPPRFSLAGLPEASCGIYAETCRRKKRYDPKRELVRAVWEADPSYSAKKIRPILLRKGCPFPW